MPPIIAEWSSLTSTQRRSLLERPSASSAARVRESVATVVQAVRAEGDAAVRRFTREWDRIDLERFAVDEQEFREAERQLTSSQKEALDVAIRNVRRFHAAQPLPPLAIETFPGVLCERRTVAIGAVGLYVPAGTAPLPSTAIMLAVPAELAGCRQRVLCTPPRADGGADPAVLHVARRCEVSRVYKIGGAQAIAALAFGTEQIARVDKIFGPGNAWVTAAKELVSTDPDGCAVDLSAGPSEVLVIADDGARVTFVAADLLAQAEHSPDAQAVLLTTSLMLANAVSDELNRQLNALPSQAIARRSLDSARLMVVDSLETALRISNSYAPEHLILHVARPREWLERVEAAGSVFLGPWSPESIGDYCSGTNHVLPTSGRARGCSGLSLLDFTRRITVQELTPDGLLGLGPVACTLAEMEGLQGHARAVSIRIETLATGES